MVETYRKKVNGGVKVSEWTYVESNAQIHAVYVKGKTLFTYVPGGRGGKIQNHNRLVVKNSKP
jgi:hypothetical protein